MICHSHSLEFAGTSGTDIHDITSAVAQVVSASGVDMGVVTVHAPGSTAAVTTIEYESGALADLVRVLEEIAPAGGDYAHNQRWHDGNGYSHVRAALMGPSLSVPIQDGAPVLGTWQQMVLLDFDNKARSRRLVVQVLGVAA